MDARVLLKKFPKIEDTYFKDNDFFVITETQFSDNVRKKAIFKNWEDILLKFDEIIKIKKYNYWLISNNLLLLKGEKETLNENNKEVRYNIVFNDKIIGNYKSEIIDAEVSGSWELYIIQKAKDWKENIFLWSQCIYKDLHETNLCIDNIEWTEILFSFKKDWKYKVYLNNILSKEFDESIYEIWFEDWDVPYVILHSGLKEYIMIEKDNKQDYILE